MSICFEDIVKVSQEKRPNKGKSILDFPDSYVIINIETTDLDFEFGSIIEIGAIKFKNNVEVSRFHSLVKPIADEDDLYIDPYYESITHITNEMLSKAPELKEVFKNFLEFIEGEILVSYYTPFVINFLYDTKWSLYKEALSNNHINLIRFSKRLYPDLGHYGLSDMMNYFGISAVRHRALIDAESTVLVYDHIKEDINTKFGSTDAFLNAIKEKSKKRGWSPKDIIGDVSKNNPNSPLYGKSVVFTGTLDKFCRKDAAQIVADLGGSFKDSITKNTDFLIIGTYDHTNRTKYEKSTKHLKAEKYNRAGANISILPESSFYSMLSDSFEDL